MIANLIKIKQTDNLLINTYSFPGDFYIMLIKGLNFPLCGFVEDVLNKMLDFDDIS